MVNIENEGEGRESGAEEVKDYSQELMSSLYRSIHNISENNVEKNKAEYKKLIDDMEVAGFNSKSIFNKFTENFVFESLRSPASYTNLLNQMEIFSQVAGIDLQTSLENIQNKIKDEIDRMHRKLAMLQNSEEKEKRNLYE